jgi:hypothetical protein
VRDELAVISKLWKCCSQPEHESSVVKAAT